MDLVNLGNEKFVEKQQGGFKDENLFTPDPAKGQNGVYKAGIRFIPWWKDSQQSMYKKYQAILTHPITNDRFFCECPSTIKESSILWDLDTLLRNKLRNKVDLDIVTEIKKNFNRYMNIYSPIYIIKDLQDSSLDGTIKLYAYGHTIMKNIEKLLKPESLGMGAVRKIDPFSLTQGKDFHAIVGKKNKSCSYYCPYDYRWR